MSGGHADPPRSSGEPGNTPTAEPTRDARLQGALPQSSGAHPVVAEPDPLKETRLTES